MADQTLNIFIRAKDEYSRVFGDLSRRMSGVQRGLQQFGQTATRAGSVLTAGLTLPIIGLGGFALKAAIDFESAFADVRKTVDATEGEFAILERGIRDMAKELPTSAKEIAGVAAAAGQLGIAQEDILGFTRVMIDLGETTNLAAGDAATQLAKLANITGLQADEYSNLGSAIVELGNNMATTEADIVEMSLRLAATGTVIGLTEAEILSFSAALSSIGIQAQAGGSAFSTLFINLARSVEEGGESLQLFADLAGTTVAEFAQLFERDAASAIQAFLAGLGRVNEAGGNVFAVMEELGITEKRQIQAVLGLATANDTLVKALDFGTRGFEENNALSEEAAKRYETTAAQLSILRNQLIDVAITFGAALLPALTDAIEQAQPLIDRLASMAERFAALDPSVRTVIIVLALVVAAIGPVLLAVGLMASGLAALIGIAPAVGAAMTVMLGPWGLVILAIAALVVGIVLLIKHWDAVVAKVKEVVHWMQEHRGVMIAAATAVGILLGPIGLLIGAAILVVTNWGKVSEFFTSHIIPLFTETLPKAFDASLDFFTQTLPKAFSAFLSFFTETLPAAFGSFIGFFTETLPAAFGAFLAFFSETLPNAVADMWDFLPEDLREALQGTAQTIRIWADNFGRLFRLALGIVTAVIRFEVALWSAMFEIAFAVISKLIEVQVAIWSVAFRIAFAVISKLIEVQVAIWGVAFRIAFAVISKLIESAVNQWAAIFAVAFAVISSVVTTAFSFLAGFIGNNLDTIRGIFEGVWAVISGIVKLVMQTILNDIEIAMALLRGDWSAAWTGIKDLFSDAWGNIQQILSGALRIVGNTLRLGWALLLQLTEGFRNDVVGAFRAIPGLLRGLGSGFFNAAQTLGGKLRDGLLAGLGAATGFAQDIGVQVVNAIIRLINTGVIDRINSTLDSIQIPLPFGQSIDVPNPNIPHIQTLATGGIVTRPTLALLGEAGPEAVIPLSRGGRALAGAGGGNVYNFHFTGPFMGDENDARMFTRLIMDRVERLQRGA